MNRESEEVSNNMDGTSAGGSNVLPSSSSENRKMQEGVSPYSTFRLNTTMVSTLSVVGATNQNYNFFEVCFMYRYQSTQIFGSFHIKNNFISSI